MIGHFSPKLSFVRFTYNGDHIPPKMSNNCPGCKVFLIPVENMFDKSLLCKKCNEQETKLKKHPFFLNYWYYRYTVEFGVRDLEWFEVLFVNIFMCILIYSLCYQATQMFIEMYKLVLDIYFSLVNFFKNLVKLFCRLKS